MDGWIYNILLNNLLNTIKTHLQHLHPRSVRQADEMVARAIEQIAPLGGV